MAEDTPPMRPPGEPKPLLEEDIAPVLARFYGVELVSDRNSLAPAKLAARWVRERMKALGVLVSSTGPLGNIIKIRPPPVFSISDASKCLTALDTALTEVPADLHATRT